MSDVLVREIAWRMPEQAFRLFERTERMVWFDSQANSDERGRYSFICMDPFGVIEAGRGRVLRDGVVVQGDPFTVLNSVLQSWPRLVPDLPVPFGGGAAGFFGYELAHGLERLPPPRPEDDTGLGQQCDLWIGLYDVVLAFDHRQQRSWLISSGLPETATTPRLRRAAARLAEWQARIDAMAPVRCRSDGSSGRSLPAVSWSEDCDRAVYIAHVESALDLIGAGDVFQVNLTTRHIATIPDGYDAAAIHLALRRESPAPFGAFLRGSELFAIACASPERFLALDRHGRIETRPIKGTRPRAVDPFEDQRLGLELLHSAKDRAENLMIVDLMRNDLGRVAATGSVHVDSLQQLESFASVHHLVSAVTAQLRPGLNAIDLLRAAFPGGSVTGAPKVRAMEIIHALEPARRGPYCGAIGWIGVDGAMDSNIVIRSLVMEGTRMIAQAGGAIVADSQPASEYAEMLTKMAPMHAIFGG